MWIGYPDSAHVAGRTGAGAREWEELGMWIGYPVSAHVAGGRERRGRMGGGGGVECIYQ